MVALRFLTDTLCVTSLSDSSVAIHSFGNFVVQVSKLQTPSIASTFAQMVSICYKKAFSFNLPTLFNPRSSSNPGVLMFKYIVWLLRNKRSL